MENKKIIFMGTPSISLSHLKTLLNHNYKIASVFTQPPRKKNRGMQIQQSPVHKFSLENKISVFYPQKLDDIVYKQLKKIQPDIIIVMAYGLLLPSKFLSLPKLGCINVHVSLLPRWRGAAPIQHTLLNGDEVSGISIIKLENKLDAGPILFQKKIDLPNHINKDDLELKLTDLGCKSLIEFLPSYFKNEISPKIQDETKVTYANKINSNFRKIDFNKKSLDVFNQIRAYSHNPGAWFLYKEHRIKLISVKINNNIGKPSTILNDKFEISCKDGSILPLLLQREGKKIVSIEEFIRGFNFSVGDQLNA